jgi:hypothetical protein
VGYGNVVRVVVPGCSVVFFEVGGVSTWKGETEAERWNEAVAVWLLQEVGAVVAWYEANGVETPNRGTCHARIVEAQNARNMTAYRGEALNRYEQTAREAHRRRARGGG